MNKDELIADYMKLHAEDTAVRKEFADKLTTLRQAKFERMAALCEIIREFKNGDIVEDRRNKKFFVVDAFARTGYKDEIELVYKGRLVKADGTPGVKIMQLNSPWTKEHGLTLVKKADE